ncbi:hypothetical protein DCS_05868 [Drechmeria coniospora]|uniref:Uncharacterized protein n=1 Tax=Drechmeria coniospora TaxID=98403 RepID=A0A151GP38_DRECN|nr:hypothetical protein DCS_05868 [Drechmeria coniospora]KYK58850.1 hypothetical protein DCS_05868 [Drechmeria coniospora]
MRSTAVIPLLAVVAAAAVGGRIEAIRTVQVRLNNTVTSFARRNPRRPVSEAVLRDAALSDAVLSDAVLGPVLESIHRSVADLDDELGRLARLSEDEATELVRALEAFETTARTFRRALGEAVEAVEAIGDGGSCGLAMDWMGSVGYVSCSLPGKLSGIVPLDLEPVASRAAKRLALVWDDCHELTEMACLGDERDVPTDDASVIGRIFTPIRRALDRLGRRIDAAATRPKPSMVVDASFGRLSDAVEAAADALNGVHNLTEADAVRFVDTLGSLEARWTSVFGKLSRAKEQLLRRRRPCAHRDLWASALRWLRQFDASFASLSGTVALLVPPGSRRRALDATTHFSAVFSGHENLASRPSDFHVLCHPSGATLRGLP